MAQIALSVTTGKVVRFGVISFKLVAILGVMAAFVDNVAEWLGNRSSLIPVSPDRSHCSEVGHSGRHISVL